MITTRSCLGLSLALVSLAACAGPSAQRNVRVLAEDPAATDPGPLLAADAAEPARLRTAAPAEDEASPLDDLIDPVSAPLTFESPLIHTSVRPLYLYHELPDRSVFKGGRLRAYAAQLRWAITDSIQFIATQDGKAELQPGSKSVVTDQSGSIDLEAGFKFKLHEDREAGTLLSAGFVYQAANGDDEVFQGNGNGVWRPFVSGAMAGEPVNLMATLGANIPVDGSDESTSIDAHLHASLAGDAPVVPLVELNVIHYVSSGNDGSFGVSALDDDFEGADYANLGNSGVNGNTLVTATVGGRWRATESGHLGVAFERPLTDRKDIFGSRWTFDWMQRF